MVLHSRGNCLPNVAVGSIFCRGFSSRKLGGSCVYWKGSHLRVASRSWPVRRGQHFWVWSGSLLPLHCWSPSSCSTHVSWAWRGTIVLSSTAAMCRFSANYAIRQRMRHSSRHALACPPKQCAGTASVKFAYVCVCARACVCVEMCVHACTRERRPATVRTPSLWGGCHTRGCAHQGLLCIKVGHPFSCARVTPAGWSLPTWAFSFSRTSSFSTFRF